MAKLLVQESNGAREFELVDAEVNLGRELDNSLRLADPSISRHHATLKRTESGYEIQDLGSSNGVLLNGTRVQVALLQDGDRITLGQLQLTYVDPRPAAAPNPLGTVRMNLDDMAKMQQAAASKHPTQEHPIVPFPLPPAPAPMAPPEPAAPFAPTSLAPSHPAPGFLRPYLPPCPDDAQPLLEGGLPVRGTFGVRLLAWLIDSFIGLGLVMAFMVAVALLSILTKGVGCLAFMLYPLVSLGYVLFLFWCLVQFRATIGKKLMKLRVVPEDNPGGGLTWGMVLLRFLGHLLSGALFDLPYLLILGPKRKGLQDIFSGSIVIKVDR